jgi:hypothetical protein
MGRAYGLDEGRVEPGVHFVLWCVVAVGGGGAGEPGCAVGVVVDRGDRGQAEEAFAGESRDDEFAAEPEFLTERVRQISATAAALLSAKPKPGSPARTRSQNSATASTPASVAASSGVARAGTASGDTG